MKSNLQNRLRMASAIAAVSSGILAPGMAQKHEDICFANESQFNEAYQSVPLTGYAVGYRDPSGIEQLLDAIAPAVMVPRKFSYQEHTNAEEFLSDSDDDLVRQIGGEFKTVQAYTEKEVFAETANKGLSIRIDMDRVADKQNWREHYTGKLVRRLFRSEYRRVVALLSAAAVNTAKTWDVTAGKDPDHDLTAELVLAQTASGIRPTRMLMGETAWTKRLLSLRAQAHAGGFANASLTPEQLAAFLRLQKVVVSDARYQASASAKAEIISNLVIMFFALDGMDPEDASNIKRFISNVEGGGKYRVFERQVTAKLYEITVEHYSLNKITSTLGIRQFTVS